MFGFLGILLTYALTSFGGVRPHSGFVLTMILAAGILGLLLLASLRAEAFDVRVGLALVLALATSVWISPRLGVPLFAGIWAFGAVRRTEGLALSRFLHFLIFLGLAEGLLGLAQYFVAPGWIFGYINPSTAPSGTFINRNHFAGLLEMLVPVSLGLAYVAARRHRDASRAYVYLMAGAFTALALVFSASRMGIVSMFATIGFLLAVMRLRVSQRRLANAMGFGIVGLILFGALWIGVDSIVERYGRLLEADAVLREGRMLVYRDSLAMIADNPWGVGVDRYRDVFRQYQTFRPNLLFDHAHNDYLETAAEWGILPAALFWLGVIGVLLKSVRMFLRSDSPEDRGVFLAGSGAIFAILLHSLTDFNLQILSNAMLFCVFLGIVLGKVVRTERIGKETAG